MRTLMSMGVLFAIILTSSLSIALAEKENLAIQDNKIMRNTLDAPMPNTDIPMSKPMDMLMKKPMDMLMNPSGLPNKVATNVTTNVVPTVLIQNLTFNIAKYFNISSPITIREPKVEIRCEIKEK